MKGRRRCTNQKAGTEVLRVEHLVVFGARRQVFLHMPRSALALPMGPFDGPFR